MFLLVDRETNFATTRFVLKCLLLVFHGPIRQKSLSFFGQLTNRYSSVGENLLENFRKQKRRY